MSTPELKSKMVKLESKPLVFTMKGTQLELETTLLTPGVWSGIDGSTTEYTPAFIEKISTSLVNTPIYFAHSNSLASMNPDLPQGTTVGFWTGVALDQGKLLAKGIVFNPLAIDYLKNHPKTQLSAELSVNSQQRPDGTELAIDGKLTGGALIETGACPETEIHVSREVSLESSSSNTPDEAKTPKDRFCQAIIKSLQDSKQLSSDPKEIETAMTGASAIFANAIEIYPQEDIQAQYSAYMSQCVSAGGTVESCHVKFKETHPIADKGPDESDDTASPDCDPQKLGNSSLEKKTMTDQPTEKEKQLEARVKELESLQTKNSELEGELRATKLLLENQVQSQVDSTVATIKTYDTSFDATKLLEGITDKVQQKKVLESYLAVLQKNCKPITLQLSDDALTKKLESETAAIFGPGTTFNSLFDIKENQGGK